MKQLFLLLAMIIGSLASLGQNAKITGIISDKSNGDFLPFVNVELLKDGKNISGATTDFDGKFVIQGVQDGSYSLRISFVGYTSLKMDSIIIQNQENASITIELSSGVDLEAVEITKYTTPIISRDNTMSGETIVSIPGRSSTAISQTTAGVSSADRKRYRLSRHIQPEQNREQYNVVNEQGFIKVTKEALSTFSIDVDRASYANARRYLQNGTTPPKNAVRIEEMINYFSYNYPSPKSDDPFSITTEHGVCPWNKEHQLIHIGIQGKKIETETTPPNNLVFLIDVSGSMASNDKLGLLKQGFNMLVDQLRPQDRIAIVVYAGAAGVVLPSTSGKNKAEIKSKLQSLNAGGSTAGGAGIHLAYNIAKDNFIKDGNNRIILATDGDFNVGVSGQNELIQLIEKKRENDIFLSVLGFGTGNIQDGKMEQLANKGNGNYNYIDNVLEAQKVLVNEFQSTLITIAKDVKTQIEFNPQHVAAYRMVGYENRALANEDFNDDKKDAGELGAGHSVTMIYEIVPKGVAYQGSIDELKYQQNKKEPKVKQPLSNELATIKLRYKKPKGTKSTLLEHVIFNDCKSLAAVSTNYLFSSAVTQFGMLLRASSYSGEANYESTLLLAKKAKGIDEDGYRAEFIKLVETAQLLEKAN
jgi:Ca-activated chloride channel family protein